MVYLALYIACIFGANWAIATFGVVPVGFGLYAPAGVYFVGAIFTLRDLTQDWLGRRAVLIAVVVGAILSALVSPTFAFASGVAFLLSELADFTIYTPLRKKSFIGAVLVGNTVGVIVDSALFLMLAFGSLDFLAGQFVGKTELTLITALILWVFRAQFDVFRKTKRYTTKEAQT